MPDRAGLPVTRSWAASDHNGVEATIRFTNHDKDDDATAELAGEVPRFTGSRRSSATGSDFGDDAVVFTKR
jgi:hypothetical protein